MSLNTKESTKKPFKRYLFSIIGVAVICAGVGVNRNLFAEFIKPRLIGPTGGSVALLNFAVVGDTRPSNYDDTSSYPSSIIQQIFKSIEALSPHPDFVLASGDYMNATPGKGTAAPQAALYMQAAKMYSGQLFPAIGNHECTTADKSNCGSDETNGITENYTAFMQTILQGAGVNSQVPYYAININSSDANNPWTAKFVFVAPNSWDNAQSSWLTNTMAQKTTFTFVIKHEPDYDNSECSGCAASDAILKNYPVTLFFYGHTHTYSFTSPNVLVVGNGGAPLDSSSDQYGYVYCNQQANNSITCTESDYNSNKSSYSNSTVTVTAAGAQLK